MFDTTLLVKFRWYSFRHSRLQYRYSDNNLRGDKVFVFRTERGADKIVSIAFVQRELKEEAIAPTPAPVVMRSLPFTHQVIYLKEFYHECDYNLLHSI